MHFLIISKKESFEDGHVNDDALSSTKAPSLIADSFVKYELDRFIVYLYTYNHIYEESDGYSYHFDEDKILIANGIFNVDDMVRDENIEELFKGLKDDSCIIGDYQLIRLDKEGNGFFRTPLVSTRKALYYEDDSCFVVSSELKLIADGISSFTDSSFAGNYDASYMYDTFHSGALLENPRHTLFKNVKRIFPHDDLIIKNFSFSHVIKDTVEIPEWFLNKYTQDKEAFYDWFYEKLLSYTELFLRPYKDNIEGIRVGLTGGFDSRITVLILKQVCNKLGIELYTHTNGVDTHPDVIVAKKVAECLDLNWTHKLPKDNECPACQDIRQYCQQLFMGQGDYDSRDFARNYDRKILTSEKIINHRGLSGYKKGLMVHMHIANIWLSSALLSRNNFFLPLLFTDYEIWVARIYADVLGSFVYYKEFVYHILKRGNPKLLEIPFAGDFLPQVDVKGIDQDDFQATVHSKKPFYWDYDFVLQRLSPSIRQHYSYLSEGQLEILEDAGINELDFVLLKQVKEDLENNRKEIDGNDREVIGNLTNKFKKLKEESIYPKDDAFIKVKKGKDFGYVSRLCQWMDYACAADASSFDGLEKNAEFYVKSNDECHDEYDVIKKSELFDSRWYRNHYDIHVDMDLIVHYLTIGHYKGFNPNKKFDSRKYLKEHPEIANDGINPFVHYIKFSRDEDTLLDRLKNFF